MKIFAVSDLHGNLEGLDPTGADLVVIAGDFAVMKGWGHWHVNEQVKWVRKKFLPWCAKWPGIDFCVLPGNHDLFTTRSEFIGQIEWPSNVHYLCDRLVVAKGVKVAGSPWIPRISGRWAWETADEEDLARKLAWIPEGVDALVTHSPPFVQGSDIDVSLQTRSPHFGSPAIAETIARVQPRLAFCGHIHSGDHSPLQVGRTTVYNVSRLDENYEIAYEPRRVEIGG